MRPARFAPAALLGEEPRSLTRVACGETAIKEDILKRDASRLLLELEPRIFDLSLFSVSDLADQLVSSLVQITNGSSGTQSQYGYSYDNAGNRTGFQSDLTV